MMKMSCNNGKIRNQHFQRFPRIKGLPRDKEGPKKKIRGGGGRETYRYKTSDTRPQRIIRQLPPTTLMHDSALINTPTNNIDKHSNEYDNAEHATGTELLLSGFYTAAGCRGAGFEDVGARVWGGDKGDGHGCC